MNPLPIKQKRFLKEGTIYFLIAIPFMIYIFMFVYMTVFGLSYAFVDFRPAFGWQPWNHEFRGLHMFRQIWAERTEMLRVLYNTLSLSFISLALSPLPVILAIFFMEVRNKLTKKICQTISTFPHFISFVIVYGIAFTFFSNTGVIANLRLSLGMERQTMSIIANPNYAWLMYIVISSWKSIGWSAIIYCAAISGIDETLYEAAKVDGASKLRQIIHITIPGVKETFIVLFLLATSGILGSNFDYIFLFQNQLTVQRLMTLQFYIYRMGIVRGQISYSVAVSILTTIIGLTLLFTMNRVAKAVRGDSII